MRARWAVLAAAALTIVFSGAGLPVSATSPVQLGEQYVLDDSSVLGSGEEADANQRLEDLTARTGVDLYVVFVDEFTNPSSRVDWADTVAGDNGLGTTQYLLAVATDGQQWYISADPDGPLSDGQLDAIDAAIKPKLRDGDYLGAITTAADTAENALSGTSGGGDNGSFVTVVVVVIVIIAIAIIIWLIVRSRRKKATTGRGAPNASPPAVTTAQLVQQAASALVDTDDAVKTSEQELGFATAQFGDAATAEYTQVLAAAKANLTKAFTLKQQLDDDVPDTEEQVRTWNQQILQLCIEANDSLDEKAESFDELRKLEQNAPEALTRVQQARAAASERVDGAAAQLTMLGATYAADALATVADNPQQARQRIAFADQQLAAAQAAIVSEKTGEAAFSIRAAEEAIGQADLLERAVGKLGTDLVDGERRAENLITELQQDIATALTLPDPDGRVATAITATRQAVDTASTALSGTQRRPLATLRDLESANQQIDGVVQSVRDAAAAAQRLQQQLSQTLAQAQAQVSAAEDYITARRGAVGATARTRLAEAGSTLVQAQSQLADPAQALQLAQRADALAGEAIAAAQNDVGSFQNGLTNDGYNSTPNGGNDAGGLLGAVLGGIVINSALGGGRGSSGSGGLGGLFGSGGSIGSGGGGSGRSSGSSIRTGSFGGGRSRGRRGGGRF